MEERIKQIIEYYGLNVRKFEQKISASEGQIYKGLARKNGFQSATIAKILEVFPEINPDWLLLGKGEMLRSGTPKLAQNAPSDDLVLKILAEKDRRIEQLILEKRELEDRLDTVLRVSADLQAVTPPPIRWYTDSYGEKYLMF